MNESSLFLVGVLPILAAGCRTPPEHHGTVASPSNAPATRVGASGHEPAASGPADSTVRAPDAVSTPVAVRVRQVSASNATCALLEDESVWCWGQPTTLVPSKVTLALPAKAVEVGKAVGCALLADRSVWCWDDATGTPTQRFVNAKKLVQVSPDRCIVNADDELACLDYPSLEAIHVPHRKNAGGLAALPIPFPVIDASVHPDQGCALGAKGQLQCWGNLWRFERYDPPGGAVAIAGGGRSLCVVDAAGSVRNFAANEYSRIVEDGTAKEWRKNAEILREGVEAVTCDGADYCSNCAGCAVHRDGRFSCWFDSRWTDASHGTDAPPTPALPPVERGSIGHGHACVITTARELLCWGVNTRGQLGRGTRTEWEFEARPPTWPHDVSNVEQVPQ